MEELELKDMNGTIIEIGDVVARANDADDVFIIKRKDDMICMSDFGGTFSVEIVDEIAKMLSSEFVVVENDTEQREVGHDEKDRID